MRIVEDSCVLKPEKKREEDWQAIVKAEERSSAPFLLHEGQVWSEEERIVIFANQAVSVHDQSLYSDT
jgi:hypothetical protein